MNDLKEVEIKSKCVISAINRIYDNITFAFHKIYLKSPHNSKIVISIDCNINNEVDSYDFECYTFDFSMDLFYRCLEDLIRLNV